MGWFLEPWQSENGEWRWTLWNLPLYVRNSRMKPTYCCRVLKSRPPMTPFLYIFCHGLSPARDPFWSPPRRVRGSLAHSKHSTIPYPQPCTLRLPLVWLFWLCCVDALDEDSKPHLNLPFLLHDLCASHIPNQATRENGLQLVWGHSFSIFFLFFNGENNPSEAIVGI